MQITYRQFDRLHKVTQVMEKYLELLNFMRSLSKEEFELLIKSLEMSLIEMEDEQ